MSVLSEEDLFILYNRLSVAITAVELNRRQAAIVALTAIRKQLEVRNPSLFPYHYHVSN